MKELDGFDWFLIVLDVVCLIGYFLSIRWAKRMEYPYISRDTRALRILLPTFTGLLILYLFGVIR